MRAPFELEELVNLTYGEVEYWPEKISTQLVTKAHAWATSGTDGAAEVLDL